MLPQMCPARIRDILLQAVFPPRCLNCRSFFHYHAADESEDVEPCFENVMIPFFCRNCLPLSKAIEPPFCLKCGMALDGAEKQNRWCETCVKFPGLYGKARAFGMFEGPLREGIHALKYGGRMKIAEALGGLLFSAFLKHWKPKAVDLICPVPLHISKMRKRGFNQVYLMIRKWPELAASAGISPEQIQIDYRTLLKIRPTPALTGTDREERRRRVKGSFGVKKPETVTGKHILLADDVFTTGATAEECARTLLKSGAASVDVITLAHTGLSNA